MRLRGVITGLTLGVLTLTACGHGGGGADATIGTGNGEGVQSPGYQVSGPGVPVQEAGSAGGQVAAAASGGLAGVEADVQNVKDIEAIKQLKARYCRLLDTKQWDAWKDVFTEDFVSDTSEASGKVVKGRDEFIAFVRGTLGQPFQTSAHQVAMPEIELTGNGTAKGIWALEDYVDFTPVLGLHGQGHYHETYVKTNGQWRIKTSKLTRIRQQIITPASGLPIPDLAKTVTDALAKQKQQQR